MLSFTFPGQGSQRPGMGDHTTAVNTAAGICAALLARERTGAGQRVGTSLVRTGVYFNGSDLAVLARGGSAGTRSRRIMGNPLLGAYRAAREGRRVYFPLQD